MVDEYFSSGDARFLDELFASRADKKLHAVARRWFEDKRPWARQMLLRYVDDGCDRPGHRGMVRQLFKLAEEAGDDTLMAHFLVTFDWLIEHKVKPKTRWDWNTQESWTEHRKVRVTRQPLRLRRKRRARSDHFSIYTRQYLQRRVLRYFRRLGFQDLERFGKATRAALLLYEDRHLERPEQLVDAWSLMHLLYHGSPVIVRHPRGIRISEGRTLGEIEPAPLHPDAWRGRFEELLTLLSVARSLVVRRWLTAWLKKEYEAELREPDIRRLKRLLWSAHEDVQTLGAELLGRASGVETLPLVEWMSLLDIDNPLALPILCELVEKYVTPDRLDLAQCVDLSCARPAPVAELGLRWAQSKKVGTPAALRTLLRLASAQAPAVRQRAIKWVTELMSGADLGTTDDLLELIDARYLDVRETALGLLDGDSRFAEDLKLWGALAESPYPDVRAFLVRHLDARLDALSPGGTRHVWATTLLAVSRGSRTKRLVLRQLADRISSDQGAVNDLVPLLAVALRSVRESERRAALAALARAAFARPELRLTVQRHVPELVLFPEEAL